MRTFVMSVLAVVGLPCVMSGTQADVISDWNMTASSYLGQNTANQGHYDRGMTMVHVAQFDAVNAVVGGYLPYALDIVAPSASPEAAAAQAAYTVLTNISRANISTLSDALARSLAEVPDVQAREDGVRLGRIAATRIIQLRAADNPDLSVPTPTSSAAGKWRITPPNSGPGIGANMRYMVPWTLRSAAAFRPGPPPALNSPQYAADLDEARLLGALSSTNRTPDQRAAAAFHAAPDLAYLRPALVHRPLPLIETARMVALYYMARTDAGIAFLEAQYAHSFWRPHTAIRLADTDGNDATAADPLWTPLFNTPNHPEYPSGTCTFTTASIEVLIAFQGDDFAFTATYTGAKPREFARLSAVVDDAVVARIAAGAHFRNSCLTGVELGRRIARNALVNFLRPAPRLEVGGVSSLVGLQLTLDPGRTLRYVIETSGDLSAWTPWLTNEVGFVSHSDADVGLAQHRFYRAVVRP